MELFYEYVYKHGLVLSSSPDKFSIAETKIDYLGIIISQGKVQLQPHILQKLLYFPNKLHDIKSVQIFLGRLNYVRQFYDQNQSQDTRILQ